MLMVQDVTNSTEANLKYTRQCTIWVGGYTKQYAGLHLYKYLFKEWSSCLFILYKVRSIALHWTRLRAKEREQDIFELIYCYCFNILDLGKNLWNLSEKSTIYCLAFQRSDEHQYHKGYHKNVKNSDVHRTSVKIWTVWFYHRKMCPKDADKMAPASDLSLHCIPRPVCLKT